MIVDNIGRNTQKKKIDYLLENQLDFLQKPRNTKNYFMSNQQKNRYNVTKFVMIGASWLKSF